FTTALVRGGPNGMTRPIEIHAHDPMRYVGDMLAWIHQAVASESQFLQLLVEGVTDSTEPSEESVGGKETLEGHFGLNLTVGVDISKVLNRIFEGICKPFKVFFLFHLLIRLVLNKS